MTQIVTPQTKTSITSPPHINLDARACKKCSKMVAKKCAIITGSIRTICKLLKVIFWGSVGYIENGLRNCNEINEKKIL